MDDILKVLGMNNWYNGDDYIQIAKGRYELVYGRERWKKFIRNLRVYLNRCIEIKREIRFNKSKKNKDVE
jgi:hypothetical protein